MAENEYVVRETGFLVLNLGVMEFMNSWWGIDVYHVIEGKYYVDESTDNKYPDMETLEDAIEILVEMNL